MIRQLLLIMLVVVSCAATPQQTTEERLLERASLPITIKDVGTITGIGTVNRSPRHTFIINLPRGTERWYVDTCHRDLAWGKGDKQLTIVYEPKRDLDSSGDMLEYEGACPLIVSSFTGPQGKRGIINFSGFETLKAIVWCDQVDSLAVEGTFACQTLVTKTFKIKFDNETHATWSDECPPLKSIDKKTFVGTAGNGICHYAFATEPYRKINTFRLMIYGYLHKPLE